MKKILAILVLAYAPLSAQQLINDLVVQRTTKFTGVISPTQIASNQNDYAPTGFSTAYRLRLSTDASRNMTGLAGGADGRTVVFHNVGSFALVLKNEDAASTAANRFSFSSDVTLSAGDSIALEYDGTSSRWRAVSSVSGATGTVTHTGGALTSNAVVLGAGSADIKVVAGITTDGTSKLTVGQAGTSVGGVAFANATSGTVTLQPVTGALGTVTISIPAATDTMALLAASQTFTNKELTSPKIGTAINDTNGNELFKFTATGSAVNEFTVANAATAGLPTLSATGGDSDISIRVTPKGSGYVRTDGKLGINTDPGAASLFVLKGGTAISTGSSETVVYQNNNATSDSINIIAIAGSGTGTAGYWLGDSGSSFQGGVYYQNTNDSLQIWSSGAARITVDSSGNIKFNNYGAGTLNTDGSGNISATSDARSKNTVSDFTTGLAAVRKLNPKVFHWKEETGLNTSDLNVSVYAQDLIAAGIPEAVSIGKGENARYSVSDRAVISALVNSVKDLDSALRWTQIIAAGVFVGFVGIISCMRKR